MLLIPTEIYDNAGNMTRIEFYDLEGEFVVQAEWDKKDAQTSKNRVAFRKWAYGMMDNIGHEVLK